MSGTATLQAQSPSGNWYEVGRCSDSPQIMAKRLDDEKAKRKVNVRAVDPLGRMLDFR